MLPGPPVWTCFRVRGRSGWVREFLEQQLGRDWQTQQSGLDAGRVPRCSGWLLVGDFLPGFDCLEEGNPH